MKKIWKVFNAVVNVLVFGTAVLMMYLWWPWLIRHITRGWEIDFSSVIAGIVAHLVIIRAIIAGIACWTRRKFR